MNLTVPAAAASTAWQHVKEYGAGPGVETGGFFLTMRGNESEVRVVALTGVSGILREPYSFIVRGEAIEQLGEWAERNDMFIAAQFHSHEGPAFLSPIDKTGGYRIEGFVSTVLPDFSDPPCSINAWSWWRFRDGDWANVSPPKVGGGTVATITFDANGVLEHQ